MGQTNTSVLSRFPEYGFKSTSVYNKRAKGRKWLLALFIFLGVLCGFLVISGIVALFVYVIAGLDGYRADHISGIASLVLSIGVSLPLFLMVLIKFWFQKGILTSSFSDYIQAKGRNRIYVKDGKFGLVKGLNYKILIPAMYDKLMWVQEDEVLKAYLTRRGISH